MSGEAEVVAKGLTIPQVWALRCINRGRGNSPASLGKAMMERPGAMGDRKVPYKAQGYGRMGGAMIWRLWRKGLVNMEHGSGGNWHPTRATLTQIGRDTLAHLERTTDAE